MGEVWALVANGTLVSAHGAERRGPWWSFTKTVIAAAALVLVRDGLLELDRPLQGVPYTLRHLLQHRSGLANYGSLPDYHEAVSRGGEPWPVPELLDRLDAGRLRYAPGEGWEYSNVGYLLAGRLIETVTGEGLEAALDRLVLTPLMIGGVSLARTPSDLASVAMGTAQGYHPAWVYHGLLVGTMADAALLLDRLLSDRLLPSRLLQEMLEPYRLGGPVPGRPWLAPGYGLGLMHGSSTTGLEVAGHTGGGPGSSIAVYRQVGDGPMKTAAVFTEEEDAAVAEAGAFRLLTGS